MNNKIRLMIAEDEPLLLKSLCIKVAEIDAAFEIIATADNGAEMYSLIQSDPPDVLFSDIEMPICNGIELIKKVKDSHPEVVSVIITGYDKFEYAHAAVKMQVKDYLLKPVDRSALKMVLTAIKKDFIMRASANSVNNISFDEFANSISHAVELLYNNIKDNYKSEINLSKLSEQYHYNELHLSRSFKQIIGCSPSKLINELRLADAKKMLVSNKKLTISEISDMLGFSSPMYFNRVFKYNTGMTPGEFREK